jgi:hypothetical protein
MFKDNPCSECVLKSMCREPLNSYCFLFEDYMNELLDVQKTEKIRDEFYRKEFENGFQPGLV